MSEQAEQPDEAGASAASSATGHAHAGPECRVCPICQGLSLLREARPEVFAHLSDALTSVLAAIAELVPATPASGAASGSQPGSSPAGGPAAGGVRVEHIDVSDDETEAGTA